MEKITLCDTAGPLYWECKSRGCVGCIKNEVLHGIESWTRWPLITLWALKRIILGQIVIWQRLNGETIPRIIKGYFQILETRERTNWVWLESLPSQIEGKVSSQDLVKIFHLYEINFKESLHRDLTVHLNFLVILLYSHYWIDLIPLLLPSLSLIAVILLLALT